MGSDRPDRNDATFASVAEHAQGAAIGLRDTVTLLGGERLGAGVVVDGNRLNGSHGGVGEIVVLRHVRGIDQTHGIGSQMAEWAHERIAEGELPGDHPLRALTGEAVTGRVVLDLARQGDPECAAIVARAARRLSRIAGVFGSLFDPQRIIVSGAIADGIEGVLEISRRTLPKELDLPAPELVASTLGADVVSIGAVAAAREAARDQALHIG